MKVVPKYKEIGERIKIFAVRNFGSVAELERQLKKAPKSLGPYIFGRNRPGLKLLTELERLGCDRYWLLTGNRLPEKELTSRKPTTTAKLINVLTRIADSLEKLLDNKMEKTRAIKMIRGKTTTGERLKMFAIKEFGSIAALEREMGKKRNSLNAYVRNTINPGDKFLNELEKLGCNTTWLLTGDGVMLNKEKPQAIAERLKKFAGEKFGSISELERQLSCKPSSLSAYVRGISKPGLKLRNKLEALGCDIKWLMTGEGEAKASKDFENKRILEELISSVNRIAELLEKLVGQKNG